MSIVLIDKMPEKLRPVQKKKEENATEVKAISKDYLYKFLTSKKFSEQVGLTAKKVGEYGRREFGFMIYKDAKSGLTHFTQPIGGERTTQVNYIDVEEQEKKLQRKYPDKKFMILGTFHFHPDKIGKIINPSVVDGDLMASTAYREDNADFLKRDIPTIDMIGMRREYGMDILVYQEPMQSSIGRIRRIAELIDVELRNSGSQKEVLEALRQYGYKAMMLTALKDGRVSREDARKFADTFAFVPVPATGSEDWHLRPKS